MTLPERPADLVDEPEFDLVEPEVKRLDLNALRSAIDDLTGGRYKVEILGGEIIVSPLASTLHEEIVRRLHHTFTQALDVDEYAISQRAEFLVDEANSPQPDLAIMSVTLREGALNETAYPAKDALLVAEVTSPSSGNDDRKWGREYKAYAKGRVPIYLLVDPHAPSGPQITVFTQPNGTRYVTEATLKFGELFNLSGPFDTVAIDSSRFPVPKS